MLLQLIANGLCRGAVYSLVALGFGLIYSTARVFHLAHGAVYVAAGYSLYAFHVVLRLPVVVATVLALVVASALGVAIELLVYRPLDRRSASPAVLMVSSLGAYTVVLNLIAATVGNESKVVRGGVEATVSSLGIVLTRIQLAQLLTSLVTIFVFALFLVRSPIGKVCRALADDPVLASVLGVDVGYSRIVVFAVGSLLAGIGAVLMALDVGVDGRTGFSVVMVAAVACIVGGLHRLIAPALGAILMGVTQSLVVWRTSAEWENAVTFVVLIAFLFFRPQGLLGARQRLEER